ncbi:protein-lysine methyltransferase METTL21C-like [Sardina pilchardus]|uniref:protein-lysine methyltransferase METTL21C-like n=1 Tax=Sardina pilchardus TaxID=27697 RepID=UPI002E0DE5D5
MTHRSPVHLDSETEIHHFLGYEITVHRLLSWNGGKQGPATSVLCKFLEKTQQISLRGKSVLELGAGTGLVSIVASLLGGWVTATDLPEVLENLTENLDANTKGRSKYAPQVEVLQWGRNLARSFPLSIYHYDFVLAADVVHGGHGCLHELLDTMCHFCHRGTTTLLWAHEFRRKTDLAFKAQLKRALHTKLLLEKGDVRIYMGWGKRTKRPSHWTF